MSAPKPAFTKAFTKVAARLARAESTAGPAGALPSTRCDLYTCRHSFFSTLSLAAELPETSKLSISPAQHAVRATRGQCTARDHTLAEVSHRACQLSGQREAHLIGQLGLHDVQVSGQGQVVPAEAGVAGDLGDALQVLPLLGVLLWGADLGGALRLKVHPEALQARIASAGSVMLQGMLTAKMTRQGTPSWGA